MSFDIQLHREVTSVETVQDTTLGIMKWGRTNSFPQTLKNLIEQSPCAKPAVARTAKFYKGQKFEGGDTVISPNGLTISGLISILADDYAYYEAFGIHCNFNIKGQVTGITPIRVADLRFNEFDELNNSSKLGYHPDFGLNSVVRKTVTNYVTKNKIKWIDRFNLPAVLGQIEAKKGGISNYQGQILYYSEAGHSSYPIPPLQAPINYVLSDIENSILVRKETATGFINTYLLKTMLDESDPNLIALENAIEDAQGARGSGKVITMAGMSPEEMENTVLEKIDGGSGAGASIIDNATTAFELDQKVINGAYLIPPILSGADQKTGFSSADLKDAYFVFNATTQAGRDIIEAEVNRVLAHSVFAVKSIKLVRLKLDEEAVVAPAGPVATAEPSVEAPLKKTTNIVMGGPGSGPSGDGGSDDSGGSSDSNVSKLADSTEKDAEGIHNGDVAGYERSIYRDFEGMNEGNRELKSTEELKKEFGGYISTEKISGKPNVSMPQDVTWHIQGLGKTKVDGLINQDTNGTVKLSDINIVQRHVFETPLKKAIDAKDYKVVVFEHKGQFYLNDGNHRVAAAKLNGEKEIKVVIEKVD